MTGQRAGEAINMPAEGVGQVSLTIIRPKTTAHDFVCILSREALKIGLLQRELIMADAADLSKVELATELTIAWLGNQNVRVMAEDVPAFLRQMHATIEELSRMDSGPAGATSETEPAQEYAPAVSVRKSLASKDHILSLIDGKPYKTLRRHLAGHGLTPEEYRARYNLRPDYPMVAPSYSEHRRAVAKKLGLGQKGHGARAASAPKPQPRRGRVKPAAKPEPAGQGKPRGRTPKGV
jgi:predicted transcriptional regulator